MNLARSPSCSTFNHTSTQPNKLSIKESSSSQTLQKSSPIKSIIKNTFYANNQFPYISSQKIFSLSNKRFDKIPLSRSKRSIKQDHITKILTKHQNKRQTKFQNNQKNKDVFIDASIIKSNMMGKFQESKLIKIRQNSLQKLIHNQLQTSKKNLWISPHMTSQQRDRRYTLTSLKKIVIHNKTMNEATPVSIAINYLIHQYNTLFKHQKLMNENAAGLSKETLTTKCNYFKNNLRGGKYLPSRIIAGIRQNGCFDVRAYIRFYSIFIGRTAKVTQKMNFLSYFFISEGSNSIQYEQLRLIIQLLCQKQNSQNPEEIVAFLDDKQQTVSGIIINSLLGGQECQTIQRAKMIDKLQSSEEVMDLLIELLKK